jgi:hypothetical protein
MKKLRSNLRVSSKARRLFVFIAVFLVAVFISATALMQSIRAPKTPQDPSSTLWSEVLEKPATQRAGKQAVASPKRFRSFTLNRAALSGLLAAAPAEFSAGNRKNALSKGDLKDQLVLSIPAPDGGFQRFSVSDSPIMEPGLAKRHPDIKTYSGRGIDDPAATIRFDLTPLGFHASVRGQRGSWYIDPYYHLDQSLYISYYGRDLENRNGGFLERDGEDASVSADHAFYHAGDTVTLRGFEFGGGAVVAISITDPDGLASARSLSVQSDASGSFEVQYVASTDGSLGMRDVEATDGNKQAATSYEVVTDEDNSHDPPTGDQLRTYRLALLTDPGYATYFGGAANVPAAKATLINRVTQLYEDDLSIRLVLIANNDLLNLNTAADMTTANGPCGGSACFTASQATSCVSATLTRTRQVIGLIVGASAFDIGHIALGQPGGGVASLGVVGGNNKAQGCTGIPTPTGDFFAVDYVAHEMGHQFAGNHTFNGTQSNCSGGNRNAATSVEPGSGSSIMAYAGICQTDNLQPHSDPYFSQRSLDEIVTYTSGAETNISEVQMGVLTGFNTNGQSFQVQYNGNNSASIVRGTNFTTAGVKAAIEAISGWPAGGTVTISALGDTAFTITFGGTLANTNANQLQLVNFSSGVTGFANEIAKGGATTRNGTVTATGNSIPTVTAPTQFTIPIRTPFALTASGSDVDDDTLTYLWEQNDRGAATGTGLVSNTKLNGPLFRQFGIAANVSASDTLLYNSPGENLATTNPTRVFPDMNQILANQTNAETGVCPASDVICFSEFLPTAAYVGFAGTNASPLSLHFRVTVRDGRGGVNSNGATQTTLLLATTAGPFLVTSPNTAVTYPGGSTQTVTWDVANTNIAPVSTTNVKISLSTDGGLTYPTVLAASAANDGSEPVTLPNISTTTARIKIEAVGNVYFDVSNADFTIQQAPVLSAAGSILVNESCSPTNSQIDPGERVSVNLKVLNSGPVSTSNLVGTLQSSGGALYPTGPTSYGVIASGGTVGRDFTFTADPALTAGQTITVSLQLQDGANNLGTISYAFTAGSAPCGGVRLVITSPLVRTSATNVQTTVTVRNTGTIPAANVLLNTAKLGATNGTPLPQSLGSLGPGDSASVVVNFTNSTPGAASTLSVGGTYTGGSFSNTARVTIP